MGWYSLAMEVDAYFSGQGDSGCGHKAEMSGSQEEEFVVCTHLVVSMMVEIVGVGVIRMLDTRLPIGSSISFSSQLLPAWSNLSNGPESGWRMGEKVLESS